MVDRSEQDEVARHLGCPRAGGQLHGDFSFACPRRKRRGTGKGQEDRHGCTAISSVYAACDRDQAAALFDQLFGDPESDARSALALGSEERIINLVQVLLIDARPLVANNRLDSIPGRAVYTVGKNLECAGPRGKLGTFKEHSYISLRNPCFH